MELAADEAFVNEDWHVLQTVFPPDWEQLAEDTGALKGLRKNKAAGPLLRTLLLHIGCGYSLRETAARARLAGLADLSDVALLKRLRKSRLWLQELASRMLFAQGVTLPAGNTAIRVFDATTIVEPGKTGSQWRLHYSLRLPSLECDSFTLTPVDGTGSGETFGRFPVTTGDYVMADRGYCSTSGIMYVADECSAHVLVRCRTQMPLRDEHGAEFSILDHVQSLQHAGVTGSWPAVVYDDAGKTVVGRLCAIRKSETAIARSQKRVRDRAARKQNEIRPITLEMAKYVIVFTTFPEAQFNAAEILEWYRVRWQIELVFKRFKSIAQLGHLPKHDQESSKAWLYGKLFLALATERLIRLASDFSPWGYELSEKTIP